MTILTEGLVIGVAWRGPGESDNDAGLWTTEHGRMVLEIASHDPSRTRA